MAIFILDFRDFIHCNSVQCASVANFVFFQLYYVFSIFTIGVVIFLVKLMYYILYTRKFEDNISNSYDDGTKKLEIPEEFKKTRMKPFRSEDELTAFIRRASGSPSC